MGVDESAVQLRYKQTKAQVYLMSALIILMSSLYVRKLNTGVRNSSCIFCIHDSAVGRNMCIFNSATVTTVKVQVNTSQPLRQALTREYASKRCTHPKLTGKAPSFEANQWKKWRYHYYRIGHVMLSGPEIYFFPLDLRWENDIFHINGVTE